MIRKRSLDNGLILVSESMPDVRSVCIGVWLRRGSRNEPARSNGISHFIEHLVFKGTEKHSAREIALAMDSVGGQIDAFTSKEYTCFYAKVLDEHLDVALDLLAEIVQRPLFDAKELERERQVVLEEIRMVEDTPDDLVYDLFSSRFYPNHALGRPIQGTRETVRAMDRPQLLRFFRRSYRPQNMLIVAAGNLDHRRLSRMVRSRFGDLEAGAEDGKTGRPPRPRPALVKRSKRDLGQMHLLLGLPAFAADARRRYPLYVLNAILGGTMSSRLFQKIREEQGLAYSVYSAVSTFSDTGFFSVYVATRPSQAARAVDLIKAELADLTARGPDEQELAVAKEHLKGSLMLSLESTSARMSNLARQEIYFGRQLTLAETVRGVDAVDVASTHGVACEFFEGARLSLAAVGPTSRFKIREKDLSL